MVIRKALQDAGGRFEGCSMETLHHLGFCDLTKYGRLTAPDVDDVATWCHKTLSLNPNYRPSFDID